MALKIGQPAPGFKLMSHLGKEISLESLHGKNIVLAFFPQAYTPIWSNQIPSYEADKARFAGLNTQVLGISIDHIPVLKAWAESLGGINYPLLSDFWPHGDTARRYGVFREPDGFTERAIFIIDSEGIIRYIDIHEFNDQPDNEVLFAELKKITPESALDSSPEEEALPELPHGGIVMYCDRLCPDCKLARAWFKRHKLEFREVDITTTPGASAQVRKWADGKLVTPTFDIDGTIVVDFDITRLQEVLKDRLKQ